MPMLEIIFCASDYQKVSAKFGKLCNGWLGQGFLKVLMFISLIKCFQLLAGLIYSCGFLGCCT